jgi:hypothetical protein
VVNDINQLLNLNRKQFGLIKLKSLNFISHIEVALNLITSSSSTEFKNLRSHLNGHFQVNLKLHSYTADLYKKLETAYRRPILEIQDLQARSSHSDQIVHPAKTNLAALKKGLLKANRNLTGRHKTARVTKSKVPEAGLINTKWSDNTLATVKVRFEYFMSEVFGKTESKFDKRMIRKMSASLAKSITTSEHGFNKGAQDIPLPMAETLISKKCTETSFESMITSLFLSH